MATGTRFTAQWRPWKEQYGDTSAQRSTLTLISFHMHQVAFRKCFILLF